jgi:hypothetical protein
VFTLQADLKNLIGWGQVTTFHTLPKLKITEIPLTMTAPATSAKDFQLLVDLVPAIMRSYQGKAKWQFLERRGREGRDAPVDVLSDHLCTSQVK